jgi:hypothetical protein
VADRYLVGTGSRTWDGSNTAIWSATSGGATGASAPTSSDNVIWDVNSGAGTITVAAGAACAALTITPTAAKTHVLSLATNFAPAGALTITGNGQGNPILVQSSVVGTQRTFTAAVTSLSDVHFQDIAGAGAGPWSGTRIGDCGGNTGITVTPSETQTATGTASFTWSTHGWTTRVPLPQDDVVIPNAFIAGRTITVDMPRVGRNVTFTCTGNPALSLSNDVSTFGSVFTLASGMTWTFAARNLFFQGRNANLLLTSAGVSIQARVQSLLRSAALVLQDALTITNTDLTIGAGDLDTNGFSLTAPGLNLSVAGTRTVNLRSSTITLNGTGTPYTVNASGLTLIPGTSTIKITDATPSPKTFAGGGLTYNNIWLAAATRLIFTGSNTFNDLKADTALATLMFTASTSTTVNSFTVNGTTATGGDYKRAILFGVAGGFFSSPDSALASVTGDIDVRVHAALDDWTPAAGVNTFISKYESATGLRSYLFQITGSGLLRFYASIDGTAATAYDSTVAVSVTDGALKWVRATRVAATGVLTFYTSDDGTNWTQLGATVATTAGNIADVATGLQVGAFTSGVNGGDRASGAILRAQVLNGIGGAVVVDFNPNDYAGAGAASWNSATTGEPWTRNGNVIVSATNQVAICSATAASHTLTKAGGGQVICENVSVNRSTAGPGSSFIAISSNSIDGGNNSGWVFGGYTDAIGTSAGGSGVTGVADSELGVTPLRDREPESFRAGDTLVWTKSLPDYSAADGWVLAYRFISPTSKFDLTTSAYGTDHLVVSFASAAFAAGTYTWQAYVTRADERFTVGKGTCKVLPNLADVTDPGYDDRSFNRKALDALNDGLEQYGANAHVHQYSVEGRMMTYRTFADFMAARDRLRQEVAREDAAQRARAGGTRRNQVRVKFT